MGRLDEFLNFNDPITMFLLLLLLYINGLLLTDNNSISLKDHVGVLLTPSGREICTSYFVQIGGIAFGDQSYSPPSAIRAIALSSSVFSVFDYERISLYEGECLRLTELLRLRLTEQFLCDIIIYHFLTI